MMLLINTIMYFYRYRHNDDFVSNDFMMNSVDDDLFEYSSLNSTVNLSKDEDSISGDVHLILQSPNNWIDT